MPKVFALVITEKGKTAPKFELCTLKPYTDLKESPDITIHFDGECEYVDESDYDRAVDTVNKQAKDWAIEEKIVIKELFSRDEIDEYLGLKEARK